MGASLSQNQFSQAEKEDLIAAGLSAALDCKVVTKEEYERRKDEPEFQNVVEDLDLNTLGDVCYEPAKGQFGDVFGNNGKSITLSLRSLSGRKFDLTVGEESYVEELKFVFEEQQGLPFDHKRLIFMFKGKELKHGFRLSDYKIDAYSELTIMPYLKASAGRVFVMSSDLLDPKFNYDFTNLCDDGDEYKRGEHTYSRPYGWYRHALKVKGKYEDDSWLGELRDRTESSPNEWPVSYHGTDEQNANSIARNGYLLSKGKRELYGHGIYSTPSIEVAEGYAAKFYRNSKKYKLVFQNRVNPVGRKVVPADEIADDVSADYWIQPSEKDIRPYGVCIKEL